MASTLSDYLVPEAVVFGLEAETAEEVIRRLGSRLQEVGYVHSSFVDGVLQREQTHPTGLPLGGAYNAAIPHTDPHHVIKSGVALATLARPVIFQNMIAPEEAVPVQLVFMLALDNPKAQIEMLEMVAQVLQDTSLVNQLVQAQSLDQLRQALDGANS